MDKKEKTDLDKSLESIFSRETPGYLNCYCSINAIDFPWVYRVVKHSLSRGLLTSSTQRQNKETKKDHCRHDEIITA